MKLFFLFIIVFSVSLLDSNQSAFAVEAAVNLPPTSLAEPDLDYGEEINETCAACHGEYGEGTIDGEYPRLAGLPRNYLEKQLRDFKSRARLNIPMLPYATERELPEEDLQAVAAYLESIKLPTKLEPLDEENFNAYERLQKSKQVINIAKLDGDIEAGKKFYDKECANCHAKDGYGKIDKLVPPMTGQHSEYLRRQIQRYRDAERLHDEDPGDREIFLQMTDKEVHDMLSYLSILDDN